MRTKLVRLGHTRGIRIPKALVEQCGFGDTVELRVEKDVLIIAPDRRPRQGWEEAFAAAGSSGHDPLMLVGISRNKFDDDDWEWSVNRRKPISGRR